MNKSTPLNQLPHPSSAVGTATMPMPPVVSSSGGHNQVFVNDQQRQMVAQAQHAAQNFQMPQNTQMSADVLNTTDDDATVQEVLNQLNQSAATNNGMPMMNLNAQQPPTYVPTVEPMMGEQPQQPFHPSLYETSPANMAFKAGMAMLPGTAYANGNNGVGMGMAMGNGTVSPFGSYAALVQDADLKTFALVIIAYVIVTLLPVEQYVYQYISLYKIPYSDLLVKAVLCGAIVYVLSKFL